MRSEQYNEGRRNGVKWAVTWLHQRALEMNDQHARQILNLAATDMGKEATFEGLLNGDKQR